MLLKKNVLNKIKKEHSLKISRTAGRSNGTYLKLDDLLNLLIKFSSEKVWLLYELPFSLNPCDKPNNAQT